ncbi:MAG TPA: hypothetical protein PLP17_07225 [Oligoflexia bacterium]|nr:hypothetical protein [Oligoflexia bacterium]
MVEFALSFVVFLLFVYFLINCALIGFKFVTLQYVANLAARQALLASNDMLAIRNAVKNLAEGFQVRLQDSEIQVCNDNQLDTATRSMCDCTAPTVAAPAPVNVCRVGSTQDFMIVRIQQNVTFLYGLPFKHLTIPILAAAVGMREQDDS